MVEALGVGGATIADVHVDSDHDRCVLSAFGDSHQLAVGLGELARAAAEHLDLRRARGVHPRTGVLDVVPIVAPSWTGPLPAPETLELLASVASSIARVGIVPVAYGWGEACTRTGEVRALGDARAIVASSRTRLLAPAQAAINSGSIDRVGITILGTRAPLVACNLWFGPLADPTECARVHALVQEVAAGVRERGGGPTGVRTLALTLHGRLVVQLSMNVEQPSVIGPEALLCAVDEHARQGGLRPTQFELVGLAPTEWLRELHASCLARDLELVGAKQPVEHWLG